MKDNNNQKDSKSRSRRSIITSNPISVCLTNVLGSHAPGFQPRYLNVMESFLVEWDQAIGLGEIGILALIQGEVLGLMARKKGDQRL